MSDPRRIDFRYAPPVRWTCIGRPDDYYKTLVGEDGTLLFDFERDLDRFGVFRFKRTVCFRAQTDYSPLRITQSTESARVPFVRTSIEYPNMRLDLTAFGRQHDDARRTDVVLWQITAVKPYRDILTGVRVQVQELHRRFTPPTLSAGRAIYSITPETMPRGAGLGELYAAQAEDTDHEPTGELALVSSPQPLYVTSSTDFGPSSGLTMHPALLGDVDALQGAIMMPLNHADAESLTYDWACAALEGERVFWTGYDLQPLAMTLPDKDVEAMVTASARNILQAREFKNGHPEFQVGPTVYRGLWVVDGFFFLEAARYLGHATDADQGLEALLKRVDSETGAIAEIKTHLKETGVALATLARQTMLSGDNARLEKLWPVVRRAVAYIQTLREASKERGPGSPEYGLMPRSFGDGGVGGRRAEYTTALWTLVGLKEIAMAAQRLGQVDDHHTFQNAFDHLLETFHEHAERDRAVLPDGTSYLPMAKPGGGEHHWIPDYDGTPEPWRRVNPASATWALAHAIYPGEVFAPDDPIVLDLCRLLDRLDDEEGIPAATGWLPYRAVWSYSASFYAHVFLYAGQHEKAIDYLYAFANHASPCRVWREEQSLVATHHGQFVGDMPHNWASVEFIRLVRHLLVFERGDTLELLAGLPPEWLQHGRPLRLEKTPTRFGPVSLTMAVAANGTWMIAIELDSDWPYPASKRRLHVPGARQGKAATVVMVNHRIVELDDDGTILLPHVHHISVCST